MYSTFLMAYLYVTTNLSLIISDDSPSILYYYIHGSTNIHTFDWIVRDGRYIMFRSDETMPRRIKV